MEKNEKSLLKRYVPITDWIQSYSFSSLKADSRAGITVGILLIPQGMAYAMLAGLPPIYGLYAAMAPLVIYTIFGTSHQLGIGPVAIISILLAAGVGSITEPGSDEFIALALVTAFLVGVTQLMMGVFQLGFLMNFVSKPVLSAFITGAAFIIGFSQAGNLLGVEIERSRYIYDVISELAVNLGEIHLATILIGGSCILFILIMKRWKPNFPAELLSVVLSIAIVWYFELDSAGVNVLGQVKAGIPSPMMPELTSAPVLQLLPTVLAIAFLSFTQSFALAKTIARRHSENNIDPNQELYGLGLANMAGSFFHAYPVAGSFSRTAVNDENGAKTSISLLVSAILVLLAILFLTPLINYLPQTVLAAIIITAVPGLVEIEEPKFLWKVRKREFILTAITFISTLIFGILEGLGIGVIISLGIVIQRSSYPNIVMLGRIPDTKQYRDLERHPEALTQTNTIIVRIDSSLYFANTSYTRSKLEELAITSGKNLEQIVIDAVGINEVDATALHAIEELIEDYKKRDIKLIIAGVKGPVRDIFERSGLDDVIGEEQFYLNITEAVKSLEDESEEESHRA